MNGSLPAHALKAAQNRKKSSALLGNLLRMAWPMIITQAALALMQFADAWMVSHEGVNALAAITPAALMVLSAATFGTGYLTAVNTLVGQAFGAGNFGRCGRLGWQGIWSGITIGILLLALLPTTPYLFYALGHSSEIRVLEEAYFKICLLAVPFQLVAAAVSSYFLATKQPRKAMAGMLLAVSLNILLNYAYIFGKFGAPKLGFTGAAWGTLIASCAYSAVMLGLFFFQSNAERNGILKPKPRRRELVEIRQIGLPAGIQDCVELVSWGLLLIILIGPFGAEHLAAATVLKLCMQLSFLPADGVGSALLALVANSIGENRFKQAREYTRIAFRISAAYMAMVAIVIYVFREPILRLFSDDPKVIAIGMQAMICVSLFQVFDSLSVTYVHALQGAGDSAWPSIMNALLCVIILLGGGLLVIFAFPHLASLGIWMAAALYIGAQGLVFWARWHFGPWKLIELQSPQNCL
jgi:MATE family multidrug resistance protein